MSNGPRRQLTDLYPTYKELRHFLRILNGVPHDLYKSTRRNILKQSGKTKARVNWRDPDTWIKGRLHGEQHHLALRIWRESRNELNPRWCTGPWKLSLKHRLLEQDSRERLALTPDGHDFLDAPEGQTVARIDAYEGIMKLLRIVWELGPAPIRDILQGFRAFCHVQTTARSTSTIKGLLSKRRRNLIERCYIHADGTKYQITEAGASYLKANVHLISEHAPVSTSIESPEHRARIQEPPDTLVKYIPSPISESIPIEIESAAPPEVSAQLSDYLTSMDPFLFEELIAALLRRMGYNNVRRTPNSHDGGVDVVGDMHTGISSTREAIQVKRKQGNVGRRVLDQLRGSLYRFDAMQGTIVTTGSFSDSARRVAHEKGAAKITLIDGAKLMQLLVKYDLGVKKDEEGIVSFDPASLARVEAREDD